MVIAQPVLIVTYLLSGDVFFLCSGMLPCFSLYLTSPSPVAHVTRLPLFAVTHKQTGRDCAIPPALGQ